jgi:predicted ribosomally synthesized peptide with nif11-like leader
MSLENAKRFIDATSNDQALRQRLAAAREPAEMVRLAIQAGSERGLTFTAEEFLASVGPPPGNAGGELSGDQLESVVGGTGLSPSQQAAATSLLTKIKAASGDSLPGGWIAGQTTPPA